MGLAVWSLPGRPESNTTRVAQLRAYTKRLGPAGYVCDRACGVPHDATHAARSERTGGSVTRGEYGRDSRESTSGRVTPERRHDTRSGFTSGRGTAPRRWPRVMRNMPPISSAASVGRSDLVCQARLRSGSALRASDASTNLPCGAKLRKKARRDGMFRARTYGSSELIVKHPAKL